MAQEQLIDYLREKTKGKMLMTPEQLATEIGISAKQQSKLRQDNKFPIPHKNIGRLVYYSIYDVANFLLNGETNPIDEKTEQMLEQAKPVETVKKRTKKTDNRVQDLSHIFMLRAFATALEQRAKRMLQLAQNLLNYANKKELADSFELKYGPRGNSSDIEKI
jgi:exonuclease I